MSLLPRLNSGKRFLFLYGTVFIAILLMTGWTISCFLKKHDFNQLQDSLIRQTLLAREMVLSSMERQEPSEKMQELVQALSRQTKARITVIDAAGHVLADSSEDPPHLREMDNHAKRPEVVAALHQEIGTSIRYSMTLNTRMLYVAVPLSLKGQGLGVLRTALPIQQVNRFIAAVAQPIAVATGIGILVIILIGVFFGNQLNQRIRKITSVAQQYAAGDFSPKILMDGQDELKLLATVMNMMAQTLRHRMEEIESEKEKMAAVLRNMSDGILALGPEKQVIIANHGAETILGFSEQKILGKSLLEATRHPRINALMDRAFKTRTPVSEEIILSGKNHCVLQISAVQIPDPHQKITGLLVLHDITEIRRLENIRKDFVANVSHELRTPLTSIKGFIETLLGGAFKDKMTSEKFLHMMSEDTSRLSRLVDDLLTLNEIEQGGIPMPKEALELQPEIQKILERFQSQLHAKKITLKNQIPAYPVIKLHANPDKFRQVLVNLLDNAIKFNKESGTIILGLQTSSEEIGITVEDTGSGIPSEAMDRIFERFFRVDKARSRELGGTGLGLAIIKHIMEAHSGRVTCQSRVGEGSTFSVFFPLN